jgi:hypothetical protein
MLPKRALTNIDLNDFAAKYLKHFRGVFMKDDLPKSKPWKKECGIINLDNSNGVGSHWVAYWKYYNNIQYFDSFGNLQPPIEVIKYLGDKLKYNYTAHQKLQYTCGHHALAFILSNSNFVKNI